MTTETTPSIMDDYFRITKEYQYKYGENTVLLMQVGAFFEVYGLKSNESNYINGSNIVDFASICQLNISEKKIGFFQGSQIVMAGFRDYTLEKYLQKLTDSGFTAVVYIQEKVGKTINRVLQGVYSTGTYLSYETDSSPKMSNNIMCIWLETFTKTFFNKKDSRPTKSILFGISTINTFTGKSYISEYESIFYMNPTTFDELERAVSCYSPSEVILLSPFDDNINRQIIQFSGIQCRTVHSFQNKDTNNEKILNCSKQTYIQNIITSFYGEDAYSICSEFNNNAVATQSFCYLLHFMQEHNPHLNRKIALPIFDNLTTKMILANHTLKQLNIIDEHQTGQLSSVLSFLNKCSSPMGIRLFKYYLLNPVIDESWLNREYNMISHMLLDKNYHIVDFVRKELRKVRDMEKICRQIILKKIYPSSISHLYSSITFVQQMNVCFAENRELCDYLCENIANSYDYICSVTRNILAFLDKVLHIDKCKNENSVTIFEENIIKSGFSDKLDKAIEMQQDNLNIVKMVKNKLNIIAGGDNDKEFVKLHETEKSGLSLQITKTRGENMKKAIKNILDNANNTDSVININENTGGIKSDVKYSFYIKDIKFSTVSNSSYEIELPTLNRIFKDILHDKDRINEHISDCYSIIIETLEKEWYNELEILSSYTARLDVLQCKTYSAKTYNYCCPKIENLELIPDKSYVDAIQIRHCLIEQLLQNEIYRPNDISLGKDKSGILLYGTNAVGKTSIIRSLGIAIIMAQSGMFVPCSAFTYKPYSSIFSRILGNDNLFKGLSTFAVEMSELRIILKMANENSLILGDELCSGTETESALSIFVTGVEELNEKKASFIFATHFHEILNYDEIRFMDGLSIKHMSVLYDKVLDCLVYDRILKDGSGTRTYGLEVCKSLYLEQSFLDKAYRLRNKYFPEMNGELEFKPSIYNSKKIRGICEVCKEELSSETHHLQQQKDADKNGFIGSFHKNHVANLLAVCEKCHDTLHKPDNVLKKRKKTTSGYKLSP